MIILSNDMVFLGGVRPPSNIGVRLPQDFDKARGPGHRGQR